MRQCIFVAFFALFMSLSAKADFAATPLSKNEISAAIPKWWKVFELARIAICEIEENFEPDLVGPTEACHQLGFNCSGSSDRSFSAFQKSTRKRFDIALLNHPDNRDFKVVRVSLPSENKDLFTAFFLKNSPNCWPYSISIDHDHYREIITGSKFKTFRDKAWIDRAKTTSKLGYITDRDYNEYLHRLYLSESDFSRKDKNPLSVLSIGEGNSDFTAELLKRGVDAWAVDAEVKNLYVPQRSKIGLAQKLPFEDERFDITLSVWLITHFFFFRTINDPDLGYQAINEMLRVTKKGGEVLINPVHDRRDKILSFFEALRKRGKVDYELLYLDNSNNPHVLRAEQIERDPHLLQVLDTLVQAEHLKKAIGNETITLKVKKLY